jgi:WS/DGAT/MGAT family acyltransferase
MSYFHYDRLSAMDAAFLELEVANAHMHVGWVGVFEAEPLATEEGGIDIDRIRDFAEAALRRNVRFRQKLAYVPALGDPVWIDDDKFNLNYHLRHACLPAPGNVRLLKRLAGRIMSQQLDRGKPLWEIWFVEGMEGNRLGVIAKVHHCLAQGIAEIDLLSAMMGSDPKYRPKPGGRWIPRRPPSGRRLLVGELWRRAQLPLSMLRIGRRAGGDAEPRLEPGFGHTLQRGSRASPSPRLDPLRSRVDAGGDAAFRRRADRRRPGRGDGSRS